MGTTVRKVIGFLEGSGEGRKGAARRSQRAVALKGNWNSIVLPTNSGVRSAFTVPWMWWRGRTWRRTSERV